MRLAVVVKPNAKTEGVVPSADGGYTVRVAAPPVEGKANERVIALLAKHFGVPKSRVTIARGATGRKKIVEIDDDGVKSRIPGVSPGRVVDSKR